MILGSVVSSYPYTYVHRHFILRQRVEVSSPAPNIVVASINLFCRIWQDFWRNGLSLYSVSNVDVDAAHDATEK